MPPRKQQKTQAVEDEEYVNGVPLSELPPPWTDREKQFFKDALRSLHRDGHLTRGKKNDVKSNMDKALDELVEYHGSFVDYRDSKPGRLKERKYQALYAMTRHFTEKYVGTAAGEALI